MTSSPDPTSSRGQVAPLGSASRAQNLLRFEALSRSNHREVRSLILAGLADHWGTLDESLNPDLDDMLETYVAGHTLVARDTEETIVGTGTLLPRGDGIAEIVRMSVDRIARRSGIGRQVVQELISIAQGWGCKTVILETSTAWTDVIAFYLRCGFEITHEAEGDFGRDTWFELHLGEGIDS